MSLLGGVPLMCCGATIRCPVADEKAGGDGTYCPGASSRWVVVLGGGHGQTRKGVEATVFEQQIFNQPRSNQIATNRNKRDNSSALA